jgi:hypothetical protein
LKADALKKIDQIKKELKEEGSKVINEKVDETHKEKEEKTTKLDSDYESVKKELKELKPLLILSEQEYQNLSLKFGHLFEAGIGADCYSNSFKINLEKTIIKLEEKLETAIETKKDKIIKRLKLLKNLHK